MGTWSTIGKGIAKGAKFVFKHRKEIEEAVTAVKDTASFVSDMKQRKSEAKTEKEYYALLEEENNHLKSTISEIAEGITALEELYNGKVQELESAMTDAGSDLATTKEDIGNQVKKLNENLAQLQKTQEAHQKKTETCLSLVTICGVAGVILAIILAIVL